MDDIVIRFLFHVTTFYQPRPSAQMIFSAIRSTWVNIDL